MMLVKKELENYEREDRDMRGREMTWPTSRWLLGGLEIAGLEYGKAEHSSDTTELLPALDFLVHRGIRI
jgi:hypothetical protein